MTDALASPVRVRFCPSPTGSPHVGLARTALFNWAFARHHGGTFVFRIEDTDAARDSAESYDTILEVMRWLGFDWDEGPEVGGDFGPYRQSERYDTYAEVAEKLLAAGRAYHCYCSQAELDERNAKARAEGRTPGYDGHCRELGDEARAAYVDEGRRPVVRFRMPDQAITFDDLVRGEITFQSEHVPDYVLVRGNGHPLYTLVNPLDDALMEITHVLRGEDLLSSTPRQIALHAALGEIGIGSGTPPRFGHLPYVMGQGNRKLSKRDPEANLLGYRDQGFLPEGLLNYLALLGWAIAEDRDIFSMEEMVAAFEIDRVNPNPARFDLKKAEAINATHLRALPTEEAARRMVPFLRGAGLVAEPADPRRVLAAGRGLAPGAGADGQAHRGRRHAGLPVRGRGTLRPRPRRRGQAGGDRGRSDRRAGRTRGAGRRSRRGRPRPSRRPCAGRSSRSSGSSRATPSGRCGWPSPAAGSPRRSSSRWSCSGVSGRWPGSTEPSPDERAGGSAAAVRTARLRPAVVRAGAVRAGAVRPAAATASRSTASRSTASRRTASRGTAGAPRRPGSPRLRPRPTRAGRSRTLSRGPTT